MRGILTSSMVLLGAAALAVPALAQQGGPPPGAGGRPGGAPGAQGAPGPGGPGGAPGGAPGAGARTRPPPPPPNTGISISAALTGRGTGYFGGVIDPPKGQICYILNVSNMDTPTMAHIHVGGPGQNGGPVVTLQTPTAGSSGGCQPIAADVAQAILRNPGGYYVNVHTAVQPAGAIRGQLMR